MAAKVTGPEPRLVAVFDIDDTILRDRNDRFTLNPAIVNLYNQLISIGVDTHLVTARANDAVTVKWTSDQLSILGIAPASPGLLGYASLHLAPESRRKSMTDVSQWKMEKRRDIGIRAHAPIVLTVGDQWGDMVVLSEDADIDALDAAFAPGKPWKVVRPHDDVSLWGLKLRAF